MILLDTDTCSLLAAGHPRVTARSLAASKPITITVITRVEALQGRFAFVLRADSGQEMLRAQEWLAATDEQLKLFPIVPLENAAAVVFDRLRENKKVKKIGRGDLLIASIALARRATLVTRNLKDFRQVPGLTVENWAS